MTVPATPSVEPFDAVDVIAAKRDGATLTDAQIDWVVEAYTRGAVAEEQMSALAMAIYLRGMSRAEIARWTDAMIASGERMDFSGLPRPTADKHSTGGGRLVAFSCVDAHGRALAPCGRCRQLLSEHAADGMVLAMPSGMMSIDEVLPDRFTADDVERVVGPQS